MIKRLVLLGVSAAAAAALTVPATASAAPQLFEGTEALGIPSFIDIRTSNPKIANTGLGTVSCKRWTFQDKVTKNNGTEIEIKSTAFGTIQECSAEGIPVEITELSLFKLTTEEKAIADRQTSPSSTRRPDPCRISFTDPGVISGWPV